MNFKSFYLRESQLLTEMPHGFIDYELERFKIPGIPLTVSFIRLEDFFKYLYVGDTYRGYRQPTVNLKSFDQEKFYEEVESSNMLKLFVEKEFKDFLPNGSYNSFIQKIKGEANKEEINDYLNSIGEANRDRLRYEEKRL